MNIVGVVFRWLNVVFMTGLILSIESDAAAQTLTSFKVTNVKGLVSYMTPLSGEWRPVRKNEVIPTEALLQVAMNSSVSVATPGSPGRVGMQLLSTSITISRPMIIRLTEASFRRIEMEAKLIEGLPDTQTLMMMQKHASLFSELLDAWNQDATTLSGKDWLNEDLIKQLNESMKNRIQQEPVSISGKVGRINLHAPRDKQMTLARDLPVEIPMNWSTNPRDGKTPEDYKVYIWKSGGKREVFARVTGLRFTASIPSQGKFYVQIESEDGRFQSDLKKIDVKSRSSKSGLEPLKPIASVAEVESISKVLGSRAKLISPPTNLRWYTAGSWPVLGFNWSRPESATGECLYRFIVRDDKRVERFKVKTTKETIQWQPTYEFVGKYDWHVETESCMDGPGKSVALGTKSSARIFYLVKSQDATKDLSTILSRSGSKNVLYLDW